MNKFEYRPGGERPAPGQQKLVSEINQGDVIYLEPGQGEHIALTCIGDEGVYKVFNKHTSGGESRVIVGKRYYVESWGDRYRHIKPEFVVEHN